MIIKDIVQNYELQQIQSDFTAFFGDAHDGAIELVASPSAQPNEIFEVAYYYGDAKPKPIIDISVMIGCPAKCSQCELGKQAFGRSLSAREIFEQVILMLQRVSGFTDIERIHKVSLGKSGEPLLNPFIVRGLRMIGTFGFSFKVSTVFPRGEKSKKIFKDIAEFARAHNKPVQLQISLISTSEEYRLQTTGIGAGFAEIRKGIDYWVERNPQPNGRKPNISLILTEDTPASPHDILHVLPPELVNVRLRPYVISSNGSESGLNPITEQKFAGIAKNFEDCGYTVSTAGIPTPVEQKFRLSSNSTLERYRKQTQE